MGLFFFTEADKDEINLDIPDEEESSTNTKKEKNNNTDNKKDEEQPNDNEENNEEESSDDENMDDSTTDEEQPNDDNEENNEEESSDDENMDDSTTDEEQQSNQDDKKQLPIIYNHFKELYTVIDNLNNNINTFLNNVDINNSDNPNTNKKFDLNTMTFINEKIGKLKENCYILLSDKINGMSYDKLKVLFVNMKSQVNLILELFQRIQS